MANGHQPRKPHQRYERNDSQHAQVKEIIDLNKDNIKKWTQNGINDEAIKFADQFGDSLKKGGLTTSQIRNFFGELRRIQMNGYITPDGRSEKTAFLMVKPKLAYAVKRHDNKGLKDFYDFFSIAYDAVNKNDDKEGAKHFEHLMTLMEAILAYHKYHGGKD
ncbi:MAG: type III-A CRISPR-associated protein Csm2 [Chitinophagales bacterium]|nr:MAG: type III-A CRISPR-associated protein Csm2 [Chitinophagales bacterium]